MKLEVHALSEDMLETKVVEEALLYPSIPVSKGAFIGLVYVIDLERGEFFPVFGSKASVCAKTLTRLRRAVFMAERRSGRRIYTLFNYSGSEPVDPMLYKSDEESLATIEEHINKVAASQGGGDPFVIFTLRGLLLQNLILNVSHLLPETIKVRVEYPLVARIADRYVAAPVGIGLLTEIKLVRSIVPVVVGKPLLKVTPARLELLATHVADRLPGLMRVAGRMIRLVVAALQSNELQAMLREARSEEVLKVLGVTLEKASEVLAKGAGGEARATPEEGGGEKLEIDEDKLREIKDEAARALEELVARG